jgi:hypothetical protein
VSTPLSTLFEYPLSTLFEYPVSTPVSTPLSFLVVRLARTGGGQCGAQQLEVRGAGADRVRVEVRIVVAGEVVAAPRVVRGGLHERRPRGLARGGHRGAARRLGLDPHGARRALVAAVGTGDVRACARQHRHAPPPAMPQPAIARQYPGRYRGSILGSTRPVRYSAAAYRPPAQ